MYSYTNNSFRRKFQGSNLAAYLGKNHQMIFTKLPFHLISQSLSLPYHAHNFIIGGELTPP
jgi:hypothetical protein